MTPARRTATAATTTAPAAVASLLADAFADLATARFLVPDPDRRQRRRVIEGQFTILTEHAASGAGGIATVPTVNGHALAGAIVWFDHTRAPVPIRDYEARLRRACGPYTPAFAALDLAMEERHPAEPHRYLALIGTRVDLQRGGVASGLLRHFTAAADAAGTASYLEAVSFATNVLYQRHGFRERGEPFPIGQGGPHLHPMWREPKPVPPPA